MSKLKINQLQLLLIALVIRLFLLFTSSFHPDLPNHIDWGIRFWQYGSKVFYEGNFWGVSWPNQPYGSILLFAFISKLKDFIFAIFWYLNTHFSVFPSIIVTILEKNLHIWLVKLPFVLADLGIGVLIYKIIHSQFPSKAILAAAVFLFNPLVIYNSTVWGQTDSLINLLALLGFWLTFKNRLIIGPFIFLSTFLFKLSLIIYLPIFIILLLTKLDKIKYWLTSIILFLLFMYLLAIPFTPDRPVIDWIRYMYTNRVLPRQGNMLNGNAFNLWFFLYSFDYGAKETMLIGNFTAKQIGLFLSIFSFIPVYIKLFLSKHRLTDYLWALLLVSFSTFLFLTNIHERYLYPIFPISTLMLFLKPKIFNFKLLVTTSIIHLLNLYNLWFYPKILPLQNILLYNHFLICRFFSLVLFAIFVFFYVQYLSESNSKET